MSSRLSNATTQTIKQIPEEGLEPTRPCGQRILSAADTASRVALVSRLCLSLGDGACHSAQESGDEAHASNSCGTSRTAVKLPPAPVPDTPARPANTHTLWPRLLQNLRASCATDWVEKYPSHVVAKWLGHSPKVAAQHYLMSRDHHFEDVVGTDDSRPGVGANGGQGSPTECDVNCASIATRNATPQASASGSTEPHETTEPAATTRVTAGSSGIAPVTKTDRVAGTGFEPVTSRL